MSRKALLLCLFAAGCSPHNWLQTSGAAVEATNGSALNGSALNGSALNGSALNGSALNGSALNGVGLAGAELYATTSDGTLLAGVDLAGAELQGVRADGSTIPLRLDAIRRGAPPHDDVYFYSVMFSQAGAWYPLCGTGPDGVPIEAVALAGRWNMAQGVPGGGSWIDDPSMITFACRGAALAKCVELGYKPWKAVGATSLRDYHQACTRMIRADFCGDGTSWTVNGTRINLYDALGLHTDTERWVPEGEWAAGGARCVTSQRVQSLIDSGHNPQTCITSRVRRACGTATGFAAGTLLVSEYQAATTPAKMSTTAAVR